MEDNDLAQADEWVVIHEMLLTSLLKRKALLSKQREGMEHRLLGHRDDLALLQSKQASIQNTRMKHVQLQMELEQQLRKTEEKLKQFGVSVYSMDQVSDLGQSTEDAPEIRHDDTRIATATTTTMVITNQDDSDDEIQGSDRHRPNGIQLPNPQKIISSNPKKRKTTSNASLLLTTKIENPFAGTKGVLSPFQTNPSRNFLALYRMLDGKHLEELMELTIRDQISMDEEDTTSEARHRREGLFHTCLLPFAVVWENDKTDEMQRNQEWDPDTPICPYELAGECADPFCVFQHLMTRKVESQKLVKELLPLPDLQLPVPRHRNRDDDCSTESANYLAEKKQRLDPLASLEDPIATLKPTVSMHETMNGFLTDEPSIPPKATFLDFSDDFVTLPPANHTPDEERKTDQLIQNVIRRPQSWWIGVDHNDEMGKRGNEGPQITVLCWMKTVYRLDVDDGSLICRESYQNIDDRAVLRLAGRLISALQFSLHSGRYDLANAVCLMLSDLCRTYDKVFPTQQLHPFLASLGHNWQINNQSRSVFEVAIEQQVVLSCISVFLSLVHEHKSQCLLSKHRDDAEYSRTWHDVLARIMELPSCNAMTAAKFQESCRIRVNKGKRNNGSFPSCVTAKRMLALAETVLKIEKAKGATFNSMTMTDLVTLLDNNMYTSNELSDPMVSLGSIAQIGLFVNSIALAVGKEGATVKLASRLQDKLDNLCRWICEHGNGQDLDLGLVSTPILAFRVCLLISIQRYDKAQHALQEYLSSKFCVYSFSDLLWSQLVMLRSRFPTHKAILGRSQHATTTPRKLCATVTDAGVKLNYFTLVGDRMLFLPFLRSEVAKKRRMTLKATVSMFVTRIEKDVTKGASMSPLIDTMDLESMPIGACASYPGSLISLSSLTFPRSLLHGGYTLRRLNLTNCEIETLPALFGNYFPNLQVCDWLEIFLPFC
jgi:hypothetical protein